MASAMYITRLCFSIVSAFDRFQPGRNGRDGNGQDNGARAAAPSAHHGSHRACAAQHEAGHKGVEHVAVAARWRHDDGDEHTVERHAQRGYPMRGQHAARHDASGTARRPAERRQQCRRVGVGRWRVSAVPDGDAEHLVGAFSATSV